MGYSINHFLIPVNRINSLQGEAAPHNNLSTLNKLHKK